MKLTGKVLWWSNRDRNGIIVDSTGNEFYFDISVLSDRTQVPNRNMQVSFEYNSSITDCLCAHRVELT